MSAAGLTTAQAPSRTGTTAAWSGGRGVLLALDGRCLERLALPLAVEFCRGESRRLDILISHPPRPTFSLLGSFLMELERQGIDYRLTSSEKDLREELAHYLCRFRHVSVILVDCLENWDEDHIGALEVLRAKGYRVVSLAQHRQAKLTAATRAEDSHREAA